MPPRIPRIFSSAPFTSSNPIASSSTLPAPPPPSSTSHKLEKRRSLYTQSSSTAGPSRIPRTYPLERCNRRRISNPNLNTRSFHSSSTNSASAKDPYEVLGVKKDATAAEIKKIYYSLAKKWHPDSNKDKGANEKFMEIQAAYDILSDDKKRQAYDRYGSASTQEGFDPDMFARGAGGFGGFQDFGGFGGARAGNAGDLFEQLFGGAFGGGAGASSASGNPFSSRSRGPVKGDDLEATVSLSFLEACNGVTRKLNITPVIDCKTCSGSGLKAGAKRSQCSTCRGTGQQTFQVSGMFMSSTCQVCQGTGNIIPKGSNCGDCNGIGKIKEKKEVSIEIPPGIEDGMKVKLPNYGDMPLSPNLSASQPGIAGDLYVRVNVKPSAIFRRQGTNLYHDAKVPLHTALLGGKIRVPTLEGDVEVKIREGTQNGEEAVLKGRGVKSVYMGRGGRDSRGDLIIGWKVQIPRSLSPHQKKILQAFADDVEGRASTINFERPPATPSPSSTTSSPSSSPSDLKAQTDSPKVDDTDPESNNRPTSPIGHKSKRTGTKAQSTKKAASSDNSEAEKLELDGDGDSTGNLGSDELEEKKQATG